MAGNNRTFTEEIAQLVTDTASSAVSSRPDSASGMVIGEDHRNNELHAMLANYVLPDIGESLSDTNKTLFLEWDRTPETLDLIRKFNDSGDPAARDALVGTNINFSPDLDEEEIYVRRDVARMMDSARESGFQIEIFDEESVSIDAFLDEVAQEKRKNAEDLSYEEINEAGERRVLASNPVMAGNIRSKIPEGGSFSIVITGDDHSNKASDLNEMLGFDYLRFTKMESEAPSVRENNEGALYDIGLVNYELNANFVVPEMERIGIEILPAYVNGNLYDPWGGESNRAFMEGVYNQMQRVSNLTSSGQFVEAKAQIVEIGQSLRERWTEDQLENDSYLKSLLTITEAAGNVLDQQQPATVITEPTTEERPIESPSAVINPRI